MNYEFPKEFLAMVTDHAASLDIEITSLSLSGAVYLLTTTQPFPAEQLEHLHLTEV
jgi:hypothetical protein